MVRPGRAAVIGSSGWKRVTAGVIALATWAALLTGCGFSLGPEVQCQSISWEDCRRAVEMARPLLSPWWGDASQVEIHPGGCARFMHCPAQLTRDERFVMVELVSDDRDQRIVRIDRQLAAWTATCLVFVRSANEGHTEPC